ncbi:TnsA endonuclease N-terminal domain-containing protein [Aquitalea sp.]|uniref:TnsA endonuclease N-terminal domain-containing protein n=1 Tax=Aquitalea sp. TaxID=1872623 RepID=UPI0025872C03|nr:TnsA endonuclease N-terminal domain-containing protein [Aquitalea sp.]
MSSVSWKRELSGRLFGGLEHQRAREIVRPTGGILRGKFPSRKTGRMVHHEGLLERDAIYLFETSPLIESYSEQPATIYFPDGKRLRRYTPDFALDLKNGDHVLVEVKSVRSLKQVKIRHKLAQVEMFLQKQDQVFLILTDAEIRQQPRLNNLKWLYQQTPKSIPSFVKSRIAVDRLAKQFPMPIQQARSLLADQDCDPFSLLLGGWLHCALTDTVDYETSLQLSMEHDHDWFYITQRHGF